MLISINNLCKSFGQDEILKNIKMTVNEKCRYGLIGVNGAGKSTLLKIITDELPFDSGELVKKPELSLGYLAQNNGLERSSTVIDEMQSVFAEVKAAEAEMRRLEAEMSALPDSSSSSYRKIAADYAKKQAFFDSRDGYNIDIKIKTVLNGMGFGTKDMSTVISTLSGGEKTRLAMAKLLLEEPELLILDEPTNHLDFKTLKWLEDYLTAYNGAILAVSHDRYFLDKVVNHIYELERGRLYSYTGGYSEYLPQKAMRRARLEKEYALQQTEIAHLNDYIDKNLARASTAASARSRIKALEAMDIIEKPDGDLKAMKLSFEYAKEPYKDVLTVEGLDISVGDESEIKLCENISLSLKRGEKLAIIGDNGIGKSSFLKIIQGLIPHTAGNISWGRNVKIGYYEQENLNLSGDKIALNELWDRFPDCPEAEIRRVLGNVLLSQDDVFKPVKAISGGERAKLAFSILMLEKANVLILDEPTNHLDLTSKEILEKALSDFGGTLIFVSHDRYLLNKVPNKIMEIKKDGTELFDGNYDFYRELCDRRAKEAAKVPSVPAAKSSSAAHTNAHDSGFRTKEQRRLEVQRKARIKELEGLIEATEAEISRLENEMTAEEVFSDYRLMAEKCTEVDTLKNQLEEYLEEWTEL